MTVEVGQIWKHDNKLTGTSLWEVVSLLEPKEDMDYIIPVVIKLLASYKLPGEREHLYTGDTISYHQNIEGMPAWSQMDPEDLPMYLLGSI